MGNILIVEDDEYLRSALRSVLEGHHHTVSEAANGKIARDMIGLLPVFDMILSDIQMPYLTGIELLQWVKANKPTKFILMTGFALIMETQKAHELGADDFIPKPFRDHELMAVVDKILKPAVAGEVEEAKSEAEYCKVPIGEFVSTPTLMFDVFVQLGERFVKVGRKGDDLPVERIKHYRERGLKHLYTSIADFSLLVKFNINVSKKMSESGVINPEKRAQFLRYTAETIMERTFAVGVDLESFNSAKDFLATSLNSLADEHEAFSLITALNSHDDYLYAHSLAVCMYSVMIAKTMGMESPQTLFRLSLCGLFHDIGKKEIDREILDKPRALLTVAERKLYESHTVRGRDITLSLKSMPSEVVQVAFEHHEENAGTGYPRGIKKNEIHPFVQIIRIADKFAELIIRHKGGPSPMTPAAAISHIDIHYGDGLDRMAFNALCGLFSKSKAA